MDSYSKIAIILHWLMAVLIIGLLLLGERTMGGHGKSVLPTLHASLGITLFVLVCVRIAWRLMHSPPPLLITNQWQALAARGSHALLYLAMFMIPLTGWLAYTEHVRKSFGVHTATWFGFAIPLLPDFDINWHKIHNYGGKLLLVIIGLHTVAALKHHFFDKDDTLRRMTRFRQDRSLGSPATQKQPAE